MKKAVIVLIISIIAIFGTFKFHQDKKIRAEKEQARAEKQLKQIDFHKYPVKNDPKQIQTKTAAKTTNTNNNISKNIVPSTNSRTTAASPGQKIPDWVYENTASNDRYYSLIHSQTNFIFTSYADCPIGKGRKMMVNNAISKAGVSSMFSNKVELMPQGSSLHGTCSKSYKGNMCYAKSSEMKEGTCKCAVHYFLDNCMNRFCVVNPTQRRIIFVEPNEEKLTTKLAELKYNW